MDTETIAAVAELRDRAEITDTLYRFALGQDLKDPDLFASAFAADAELDFRPAAARWGGEPPVMRGRDAIVGTILAMFTGRVDTTHQVTNPRITIDGDTACLTALVEAQHLLTATPPRTRCSRTPTPSTWSATASAGASAECTSRTLGSPETRPQSSPAD